MTANRVPLPVAACSSAVDDGRRAALAGRLFLALPLDLGQVGSLGETLAPWRRTWPAGGRPTAPSQWHLTLRFLGDGRPQAAEALSASLDTIEALPELRLRLTDWGAFPKPSSARVLWLGLADDEGRRLLLSLARRIEDLSVAAGYPPEAKPFRPHLTLCRFPDPRDLTALLATAPRVDLPWTPPGLVLFHSRLLPGGACHEPLRSWQLGSGRLGV